jgi:hypothetical protein
MRAILSAGLLFVLGAAAASHAVHLAHGVSAQAPTALIARVDAQAAAAKLEDLAWLTGTWSGNGLGGNVEEVWSQPQAGSMLGIFRLTSGEETMLYRFLALELRKGAIELSFKHFSPGYEPLEKDQPLRFRLQEASPTLAKFEALDPKQSPMRMTYRLLDEGGLTVVIENPSGLGGQRTVDVVYKRQVQAH